MGLAELWLASATQFDDKHVKQIISFAGDGRLKDDNTASKEFRNFLSMVPSSLLARYIDDCLVESFEGSGFALQDLINQLGRRLGFTVTHGRYRGTTAHIGYDGLWGFPDGHTVVVEVKTTDAYRIDLDAIAEYRRSLVNARQLTEDQSSILIVVGRQDTGDLEAQIRGSRHAWDVRVISVGALVRLMKLKEEVEDPSFVAKICAILIPREYTRVDGIIDIVFSAAEEARQEEFESGEDEPPEESGPRFTPVAFHDGCIARLQAFFKQPLLKHSKSKYSSADGKFALVCSISKEHRKTGQSYWFAFHPHQQDYLQSTEQAFVALGCGSDRAILLIPYSDFQQWLDGMNVTKLEERFYWHISVFREDAHFVLHRRKGHDRIDLTKYLLGDGGEVPSAS